VPKLRQSQLTESVSTKSAKKKPARSAAQRSTGTKQMQAQNSHTIWRLPDGSRSVQSPWVWRGFTFMSFIALGFCIMFAITSHMFYAVSWGFITVGWFSISMWLWRKHVRDDDAWYASQRAAKRMR
jgi:Flp pilus assembly protein TadB